MMRGSSFANDDVVAVVTIGDPWIHGAELPRTEIRKRT